MMERVHTDHLVGCKVLLKTPSGFAIFDVEKFALKEDKNIWLYFADSRVASEVLFALGFIKVDHKSAWDGDAGPGKGLSQLIQKFCKSGEELYVQDAELKASIEKKLDVICICDGNTVGELMWGVKNVLHEFIRQEKDNITTEYCLPLSKELLKALKYYLVNIPTRMLDRSFISKFGLLCYLDMNLKAVANDLRECYDKYVGIGESIKDDLSYAKLLSMALVPAFVKKYGFSKTLSPESALMLEQAKKIAAELQVDFTLYDIKNIMRSLEYLLKAPRARDKILMLVKYMEASRFRSEISWMIYEMSVANGDEITKPDESYVGGRVDLERLKFRKTLLETPSGFAIFNVRESVYKYPERVWTYFSDTRDARNFVFALGFVKVDHKSVAWNNVTDPGDKLRQLILRFCKDEELVVQNTELKDLIQSKLDVKCSTDEEVVGDLMWGLKYLLGDFIVEEIDKLTDEYYLPLSKGLQRDIEVYGINVSPRKIDKNFIFTFGHVVNLDIKSKTISKALRDKFDHHVSGIGESIKDDLLYARVIAKILVPEARHEFDFSKVAGDLPSKIIYAHDDAGETIAKHDQQEILRSRDRLLDFCEQKRRAMEYLRLWEDS
ncbi:uncharacterized protein LOC133928246 isoform X2 [Phragmites australis]|uniref:uncharacterized protein LOC133928246 isoform X2 n=1 Tax=Phragmites australis TaxID=29695 RepID=UPI002D796C99|nr:uncharacterized protein LOC133928246 isoform X2 [Phragmites australis]